MSVTIFKHFAPTKIGLFAKRGLSLTPPIYLNDLFEFAAPVEEPPDNELNAQFDQFVRDEYEKASGWSCLLPFEQFREQREPLRGEYVGAISDVKFLADSPQFFQRALSTFWGVSCFTEAPDNRLMWAHYSDSFRGFVAEFTTNGQDDLDGLAVRWTKFGPLLKVTYQREPPQIVWGGANMMECCCTKHSDWDYEREWRIILPLSVGARIDGTTHRNISFPPETLRRVICGNRMAAEDRERLRRMLSDSIFAHVLLEGAFANPQSQTVQIGALTE